MSRDYGGYQLLIDRVRKVDSDAADYMLYVLPVIPWTENKNLCFAPRQDLASCFRWAWTPQGHRYWRRINDTINGGDRVWTTYR